MLQFLAVLWGEAETAQVLALAILAARKFGARLTGLSVHPPTEQLVPGGDFGLALSQDYVIRRQRDSLQKAARLRQAFEQAMTQAAVPLVALDQPHPSAGPGATAGRAAIASWIDAQTISATQVGGVARLYDLAFVAQPAGGGAAEAEILFEAALFDSGRPVITVPARTSTTFGERILIAWNGSTETIHAIALALPILEAAAQIHVISAEGGMVPGPSAVDVRRYLDRRGIAAEARHVDGSRSEPQAGEVLLREARALGCDLIVKGAYTQSRLRQLIFGGATRVVLNKSEIPVLFAH